VDNDWFVLGIKDDDLQQPAGASLGTIGTNARDTADPPPAPVDAPPMP
jgi:hypothetical protein